MYVIFRNGKRFAELATYAAACREARVDAERSKGNYYTVVDAVWASSNQDDKSLYQVDGTKVGTCYIIRNPPEKAT